MPEQDKGKASANYGQKGQKGQTGQKQGPKPYSGWKGVITDSGIEYYPPQAYEGPVSKSAETDYKRFQKLMQDMHSDTSGPCCQEDPSSQKNY
ncbi:hypothetical protein VTO42DRAFT_1600 [Malbranchea cinnamomea]